MNSSSLLQLSAYAGLLSMCLLTGNFLLGMLISTAYRKNTYWKKLPHVIQNLNVSDLHNWTAYIALLLILLHIILLVLDASANFSFWDVLFPVKAPHQKLFAALGTISFYAIIVVIITTQKIVKRKLGFRTWKNIHLISYGTAILFLVHGLVMDPRLKDRPIDYFDAEKVLSEACFLLLICATVLRYRFYIKTRNENEKNKLKMFSKM